MALFSHIPTPTAPSTRQRGGHPTAAPGDPGPAKGPSQRAPTPRRHGPHLELPSAASALEPVPGICALTLTRSSRKPPAHRAHGCPWRADGGAVIPAPERHFLSSHSPRSQAPSVPWGSDQILAGAAPGQALSMGLRSMQARARWAQANEPTSRSPHWAAGPGGHQGLAQSPLRESVCGLEPALAKALGGLRNRSFRRPWARSSLESQAPQGASGSLALSQWLLAPLGASAPPQSWVPVSPLNRKETEAGAPAGSGTFWQPQATEHRLAAAGVWFSERRLASAHREGHPVMRLDCVRFTEGDWPPGCATQAR